MYRKRDARAKLSFCLSLSKGLFTKGLPPPPPPSCARFTLASELKKALVYKQISQVEFP